MNEKLIFCEGCRKDVQYTVNNANIKENFKGEAYEYIGKRATCDECSSEIYVSEVEDFNLKALYDAYRIKNDIISLEKILEIPQKYDIGKRPLSLLLGWGEMTFTRYCDGYLPTKQYSDILNQIYDSPEIYKNLLEQNKNNLSSSVPYEKSKRATDELLSTQNNSASKIDAVINYLLCKCEDVTPLALQKILYYIQGFYYAFMGEFLLNEDCEAWVHGPVYRDIYNRYSYYRFDPIVIHDICDGSALTVSEKSVIDSIIKNLGCYSGKTLESFTHSETPWIRTRGDLMNNAASNRLISKNLIGDYFVMVKQLHNMLTPSDIKSYSKSLFDKLN